ncbi:MAG: YebC/PmpR family DNA-binding transcriptional regulator, partial [Clostridia bacterium]
NKADAARGKIFTKIGRELAVAVKAGGPDPTTNSKLFDVIQKAKQNNMPNDNITRSLKKASMEGTAGDNYESITYEGYGAKGIAFIVECLTDNRNRTAGDVRHLFEKHGGSLGTTGSVTYMFNRKGIVVVDAENKDEDETMLQALELNADDFTRDEDVFVISCDPSDCHAVGSGLEKAGYTILSSEVEYVPTGFITLESDDQEKVRKLKDKLEELDDVQEVYTNAELDDIEEEDE